ncbi:MAG: ECF-type sigma factor [Fuerstiella sp.]
MKDDESVELMKQWQAGDEQAAEIMFNRYVNRLVGLARTRLSGQMKRRVEPEDVVMSAYRSFFRKAGDGQFTLGETGDLWKLLAAITMNKVRGQVEFHTAKKRGISAETSVGGKSEFRVRPEVVADEPSPEDAAAIVEELEAVMQGLDATQRRILELSLQDMSETEISAEVQRSGRTVRRTLLQIRSDLETRLQG